MTVDEVMDIVMKDEIFYRHSGGGITVSGGEPLAQIDFVRQVFSCCRAHGIGTAVETCGFASWANFEAILPHTDLFLYDVKHVNSVKHREQTGVPNAIILENFQKLCQQHAEIIVRIPVIPGLNDSVAAITAIVEFVQNRNHVSEIHLLPYHRLGLSKYRALEREYPLEEVEPLSVGVVKELASHIETVDGLKIRVEV
jgi:pyruvate formate lyase activating enzyme